MKAKLYTSFSLIFLGICTAVSVAAVKDSRDTTTSLNASLNGEIHQLAEQVDSQDCLSEDVHHQINMIEEKICFYIERYHDHTAQLLSIIGLTITIAVTLAGVVVPLILTRSREKGIDTTFKNLKAQLEDIGEKLKQAQNSENTINEIKQSIESYKGQILELKTKIEEDKDQIIKLQAKIEKDKEASETAAKQAKDSERLSESYSFFSSGNAKYNLGDKKGAITDYDKAIELNPNSADAYNNRGNAKSELGDKEEAIKDYDKAIELNPNDANAYNNRGIAKSDLGDNEGAIKDYDKAIELNLNLAGSYCNRGNAKSDLGDKKGAIVDYDKAIELNPKYADAYYNRGNAKSNLGDKKGAIVDYEKAIELNANSFEAYNNKAWSLCCMKEYDTALINVNKSLDIEKTDAAFDTRGFINAELLRFEAALDDFNEAIGMNSKKAEYYEHRAALYRKMAEQEEDTVKKDDLIKKAEADEAKAEGLKK